MVGFRGGDEVEVLLLFFSNSHVFLNHSSHEIVRHSNKIRHNLASSNIKDISKSISKSKSIQFEL